jgi:uncharacterized membrane protein YfcA
MTIGQFDDRQVARLIGGVLALIVAFHVVRRLMRGPAAPPAEVPRSPALAAAVGVLAGFTTMVANAAGPVMVLYLLAMGLPKLEFLGTAAWFFFAVNLFKVPFSYALGLIDPASLRVDLPLIPFAVAGAVFGRMIVPHINQRLFETLALMLAFAAGVRLLL